jgi:adenylylsulfate kinase-like enzyme
MVVINGNQCKVEFHRQLTPVTFFQRGRQVTQNRMATTAVLVDQTGTVMDTATVRPYHRDEYNRKKANEAALHKLAAQFEPSVKVQILSSFFNKP